MRRFVSLAMESVGVGLMATTMLVVSVCMLDTVANIANGVFAGNLGAVALGTAGMAAGGLALLFYCD